MSKASTSHAGTREEAGRSAREVRENAWARPGICEAAISDQVARPCDCQLSRGSWSGRQCNRARFQRRQSRAESSIWSSILNGAVGLIRFSGRFSYAGCHSASFLCSGNPAFRASVPVIAGKATPWTGIVPGAGDASPA